MEIKNAPEKIYLVLGDDDFSDCDFKELRNISWCSDKIYDHDIEYLLASSVAKKQKKLLDALELLSKFNQPGGPTTFKEVRRIAIEARK